MSKEQAYSIFETIAVLGGCRDRLHLYELTLVDRQSEELEQDIEEQHIERMAPFTFSKCNIAIGSEIMFVHIRVHCARLLMIKQFLTMARPMRFLPWQLNSWEASGALQVQDVLNITDSGSMILEQKPKADKFPLVLTMYG